MVQGLEQIDIEHLFKSLLILLNTIVFIQLTSKDIHPFRDIIKCRSAYGLIDRR